MVNLSRRTNYNEVNPKLKTLEWDILNLDRLINLEINNKRRTNINPDIHHSKVPSSGYILEIPNLFVLLKRFMLETLDDKVSI